jgi:hypothetical protein
MDQHILRTWVSRRGRVTVEPIFVKRLPLIKALLRVSLATLSRSALLRVSLATLSRSALAVSEQCRSL